MFFGLLQNAFKVGRIHWLDIGGHCFTKGPCIFEHDKGFRTFSAPDEHKDKVDLERKCGAIREITITYYSNIVFKLTWWELEQLHQRRFQNHQGKPELRPTSRMLHTILGPILWPHLGEYTLKDSNVRPNTQDLCWNARLHPNRTSRRPLISRKWPKLCQKDTVSKVFSKHTAIKLRRLK